MVNVLLIMRGIESVVKLLERNGKAREAMRLATDYIYEERPKPEHFNDELDWVEFDMLQRSAPTPKQLRNLRDNADHQAASGSWNNEHEKYAVASDFYVQAATLNIITQDYARFSANVTQAALNDWLDTEELEFSDRAVQSLDVAVNLLLKKEYDGRDTAGDGKRGHYVVNKGNVKAAYQILKAKTEVYAITGRVDEAEEARDEAIHLLKRHNLSHRYIETQTRILQSVIETASVYSIVASVDNSDESISL